jgi:hypothetical protein
MAWQQQQQQQQQATEAAAAVSSISGEYLFDMLYIMCRQAHCTSQCMTLAKSCKRKQTRATLTGIVSIPCPSQTALQVGG